ncbi:MAG: signal peptidase II [Actinomycetota bacterium]
MHRSASIANGARNAPVSSTYRALAVAAVAVIVMDQVTKEVALSALDDGSIDLIRGAVSLRLVFNSGGAFGIFQGVPGLFLVATVAISALILVWARKVTGRAWGIPLGMVLGGGLGNVADRLFRDTDGRVVDFVDLHVWPVFNVADMAIVTGVGLLLILSIRAERSTAET